MAYNVEAGDAGGVNVKALLATPGVSDGLAARVTAADADGSGVLSLAELVSVFRSEEDAVKDKRMMRRCGAVSKPTPTLAPAGCCNLNPRRCPQDRHRDRGAGGGAAMTGLTWAVVALSKDSKVGDSGVMVVKGGDVPVSTGEWVAAGAAVAASCGS
jgi:hypothetical protein